MTRVGDSRAGAGGHAGGGRHEPGAGGRDPARARSARTSTTGSTWWRSSCRRCASAARTSSCIAKYFLQKYGKEFGAARARLHAGRARRDAQVRLAGQHPRAGEPGEEGGGAGRPAARLGRGPRPPPRGPRAHPRRSPTRRRSSRSATSTRCSSGTAGTAPRPRRTSTWIRAPSSATSRSSRRSGAASRCRPTRRARREARRVRRRPRARPRRLPDPAAAPGLSARDDHAAADPGGRDRAGTGIRSSSCRATARRRDADLQLSARVFDSNTIETIDARWFVNYDPRYHPTGLARRSRPIPPNADPTVLIRDVPPRLDGVQQFFDFAPYQYRAAHGSASFRGLAACTRGRKSCASSNSSSRTASIPTVMPSRTAPEPRPEARLRDAGVPLGLPERAGVPAAPLPVATARYAPPTAARAAAPPRRAPPASAAAAPRARFASSCANRFTWTAYARWSAQHRVPRARRAPGARRSSAGRARPRRAGSGRRDRRAAAPTRATRPASASPPRRLAHLARRAATRARSARGGAPPARSTQTRSVARVGSAPRTVGGGPGGSSRCSGWSSPTASATTVEVDRPEGDPKRAQPGVACHRGPDCAKGAAPRPPSRSREVGSRVRTRSRTTRRARARTCRPAPHRSRRAATPPARRRHSARRGRGEGTGVVREERSARADLPANWRKYGGGCEAESSREARTVSARRRGRRGTCRAGGSRSPGCSGRRSRDPTAGGSSPSGGAHPCW